MKPCFKSVLVLFAVVFAFGAFQVEDASAQGPIIRRMREKLNQGKPLLPFVGDLESAENPLKSLNPAYRKPAPTPARRPSPTRKPTPARTPTPTKKSPTPAVKPTTAATKNEKFPSIKLQSNSPSISKTAGLSGGFGMVIAKAGESFVVSQIDSRGNAASAGIRRGDGVLAIGGAKLLAIEEFDGIADAMSGGDRVEFEIARRGSKPEKVLVQYGQPEEIDEQEEAAKFDIAPSLEPLPTKRVLSDRYEPSGLTSVYDGAEKPSSVLTPSPAPSNRVESLGELDFPALDGGK